MKEVNMKPEEIANLVVLSREKGYAIIIPQDALYLVSKAFQKLISQRDAQIAALDEAVRVQVENVVQANSLISQLRQSECDLEEQVENNEAQIAALAKQKPIGIVKLGEYDDCGNHPDATVVCLHEYADWDNFQDGTELFTRAAPPAPVKLPSLKQAISGERYVWSDGVCNYQQDVIEILKAAGVIVEVADE